MKAIVTFFSNLRDREEGQTLTEYGLLLFFIAVAAIAAVTALGVNVTAIFQDLADTLGGV